MQLFRGSILLCGLFFVPQLWAQSITPFTLNIAGFSANQSGYSLTISTGETISITNFKGPNGESLSSGFLQNNPPLVTGINDIFSIISQNEVIVSPNPTTSETFLNYNFNTPGQLQYQILDATSKLLFKSEFFNSIGSNKHKIDLNNYNAGIYYILIFFKANSIQKTKAGLFKLIKM